MHQVIWFSVCKNINVILVKCLVNVKVLKKNSVKYS